MPVAPGAMQARTLRIDIRNLGHHSAITGIDLPFIFEE